MKFRNYYLACRYGGKGIVGSTRWRALKFAVRMSWARIRYGK